MKYDVPFLPDIRYVNFLQEHEQSLYAVHYSLLQADIPDGRHKTFFLDIATLNRSLSGLAAVKKYALLNSRFHSPSTYLQPDNTVRILCVLEELLNEDNINGIIVVDFYLMQALSDASPEITSRLEAVPGINCMLDSMDSIQCYLETIGRSNFRIPSKLNLDRSLNRRMEELEEVAAGCCEKYPDILLTLLANEGCLFRCPFKFSHDAHIAHANLGCANRTFEMNRSLGCIRILSDRPEEILRSPFIRPEDQKYYAPFADVLKICGRTLGPDFLIQTISAYIAGTYGGNLLALLDTQNWQRDRLILANTDFSRDFLERLTTCGQDCRECGYCKALFDRISRLQPCELRDYRNPEPAE
ncbi:MAG: hypothetical protein SCH71_05255 [Desulfobulbaceae bacterium]|nr:hypothetical protein [Desulfobulbaceae bacterium]